MIFAVAELQKAVISHFMVAVGSRAIEADALEGDFLDFTGAVPQVAFQGSPIGLMEAAQDNAEAIIRKLDRSHFMVEEGLQRLLMTLGPVGDLDFAVAGLGEDEGQPSRREVAVRESLVQVMVAEVPIQDVRETQLVDDAQEQRNVIDAFMLECQLWWCHARQGMSCRVGGHH